jgi:hypothetical protein
LVDGFDVEKHRNVPEEPQDEGVPEHNVDLGAGNGQPCNVMTDSQCDVTLSCEISTDYSTTPAPDPGPSNVLRLRPVFDMGPDSEVEENDEGDDEPEESGGDCLRFWADMELVPSPSNWSHYLQSGNASFFISFPVQNILYYQIATLCTNEGHIGEQL